MQKEQQTAPEMEEEQEYLTQTPSIQWFPGHMAKTRRVMKESLGLVDIVVELRDARIPKSSRNPEIEKIIGDKPRLVVFNKADIADPAVTKEWQEYYHQNKNKEEVLFFHTKVMFFINNVANILKLF